jgi:hypothetical protein
MKEVTSETYYKLKKQGNTRAKIAEVFEIPEWKLKKVIAKNGWGTKKRVINNEQAFLNYSEDSCYWAGFIAADGCMTGGVLKIMLHYDDTSHLKKFKQFVQSSHTISSNTDKYYRSEIGFKNSQIREDLIGNFNITPNKSLTYKLPNIPEKWFKHFLRGYFDGDGCICESFSNRASITATLYTTITGSNSLIESVYSRLTSTLGITGTIQQKPSVKIIKYNTNASIRLLDYLYADSSIYLDRKYLLYREIVVTGNRKIR